MFQSPQLKEALDFFVGAMLELSILFLLISIFVAWINSVLPPSKIRMLLAGNRGYAVAVSLGAVTPFCSCSTLPTTIGLLKAKADFGPVMTFLFTSPLLNPYIVGLFWITFGVKITLIYGIFVITLAILSGFLLQQFRFDRFIRPDVIGVPENSSGCGSSQQSSSCGSNEKTSSCGSSEQSTGCGSSEQKSTSTKTSISELISASLKQFFEFLPYMILGVTVGAFLHGFVPISFFSELAKVSTLILIPLAAIIGVFLYIRASTMVPIAASLAAKGMSMGAIMSLTIGGAGASLPEMIMLKKLFRWPLLFAFILAVFTTAVTTGFAIDLMG